jgi:ribosome-binding factor A
MRLTTDRNKIKMDMREANMLREIREGLKRLGIFSCRVTNIRISSDWRYARIYCISNGDMDDSSAVEILEAHSSRLSRMVRKRCGGHFFPTFRFLIDLEERRADRVSVLLRNLPDL